MSQQKEKRLIIFWHWKELKDSKKRSDEFAVEGDSAQKIIRIDDENEGGKKTEEIKQIIKNYLNNSSDFILLLHRSSLSNQVASELEELVKSNAVGNAIRKIDFFGGGKSYMYYKPESDTGLLNNEPKNGDFVIGELHKWKDPVTGESKRETISVTVEGDDRLIKKQYFEKVWNYYAFRTKQVTFELHEDLFIYLVGLGSSKAVSLIELLKEEENGLRERVLSFCTDGEEQVGIRPNQKIYEPYKNLVAFLQTELVNQTDYLSKLREQFAHLLNAMPEKIYG